MGPMVSGLFIFGFLLIHGFFLGFFPDFDDEEDGGHNFFFWVVHFWTFADSWVLSDLFLSFFLDFEDNEDGSHNFFFMGCSFFDLF